MKLRTTLFIALIALLLTACNFTLAEDVTPPPSAVQQPQPETAMHGPVFPEQAPDPQNGAAIYTEKCAGCHGEDGLANSAMSEQLAGQGVTVPALADSQIAHQATPLGWYMMVTLGNMENFMPPFDSLNDQERWNVVAYAQSLSSTSEQISQGESLFEDNCANCPTDLFTDQEQMASLSTDKLVSMLAEGGEGVPALGDALSQDELTAVAAYLRTLTYGAPSLAAEPASNTQPESPSAAETPAGNSEQAEAAPEASGVSSIVGSVGGTVVNASGGDIPAGATITVHGFEHASSGSDSPQEVITETVSTDKDGVFTLENVDISEGRIFLVEAAYKDVVFQSEMVVSEAGMEELIIPDIMVYDSTTDDGGLVVEQLHISFDMATEGAVQVFELFTISNLSDKAYVFSTDGSSLPFMPLPEGALDVGLELSQDSAPIMPTESGDFAIPPSQDFYSIIAFFSMPYDKSLELSQSMELPVSSALIIVPEGIKVKSDVLTDEGLQQTQQGANVTMYTGTALKPGTSLEMSLSGKVSSSSASVGDESNRQTLLIGAGAFGVVLILAGVWMFLRDRDKVDEDDFEESDEEENEFDTAEEVMDAIIALDDLHRAKKIPDEAYQQRRAELKELLKELA